MNVKLKIFLSITGFILILAAAALILKEEFGLNYNKKVTFENKIEQYYYKEKANNTSGSSDKKILYTQDSIGTFQGQQYFGTLKVALANIDEKDKSCRLEISNLSECIYKDFILNVDFLDFSGYILETKKVILDGVTANQLRWVDLSVPDRTCSMVINSVCYNYYTKDEILFWSYPYALTLDQTLNNGYCKLSLSVNSDGVQMRFKKKCDFTKAVLMLYDKDGAVVESYVLTEDGYDSVLPLDTSVKYYSVNLIR